MNQKELPKYPIGCCEKCGKRLQEMTVEHKSTLRRCTETFWACPEHGRDWHERD